MADTSDKDETVVTGDSKTTVAPPVTPPETKVEEKKTEDSEIEKLRKEKEQVEMERNQLRNKLSEKEKADAEAEAKDLEEKEEFKKLYEQEKAKTEELEKLEAEREKKAELRKASNTVLADMPDSVKELAKELDVKLEDTSDEAVAAFKTKLEALKTRVSNSKVTPNNPGNAPAGDKPTGAELREILRDPVKRDEYYRKYSPVTAMMMGQPKE